MDIVALEAPTARVHIGTGSSAFGPSVVGSLTGGSGPTWQWLNARGPTAGDPRHSCLAVGAQRGTISSAVS
jgi:hypothetical protein